MARDFTAIRTPAEAKEALVGSKVVSFEGGKITFETPMGERFAFFAKIDPVQIVVGGQTISVMPIIGVQFENLLR